MGKPFLRWSDCKECGSNHTHCELVSNDDYGFKYKVHCLTCGENFEIPVVYTADDYSRNKTNFRND